MMRKPEWMCYPCARAIGWSGCVKAIQGFTLLAECDCCMTPIAELNASANGMVKDGNCIWLMVDFSPTWEQIGKRRDELLAGVTLPEWER